MIASMGSQLSDHSTALGTASGCGGLLRVPYSLSFHRIVIFCGRSHSSIKTNPSDVILRRRFGCRLG